MMISNFDHSHVFLTTLQDRRPHLLWSEGAYLLFVLRGTVHTLLGGERETLQEAGLLFVNPLELCQVSCTEGSCAVTLQIPQDCLKLSALSADDGRILCSASGRQALPLTAFNELRRLLAKSVSLYLNQKPKREIYTALLEMLEFLHDNFPVRKGEKDLCISRSAIVRLDRVLHHLHQHWMEDISVAGLAEQVHVSPNYLSRFFANYLHMTITDYLLNLRLRAAQELLENSSRSVTEIALETGFSTPSALIRKFRQHYSVPPGKYRAVHQGKKQKAAPYGAARPHHDLSVLFDYMPLSETDEEPHAPAHYRTASVDAAAPTRPLRHTWRRLLNFGYAREGLLAEVQQQIVRAQREIGFEYIRFHGIFDDNMQFYHESPDGKPLLNFLYIDLLLDFLVGQGFKLYIELGLMPQALKKYDIFLLNRESNYSVAADPEKWRETVRLSIRHWINRYGRSTVREWRFTTIGLHVPVFTEVTFEEFYAHYQASWRAVKESDPCLQFGGPGGFASIAWNADVFLKFLRFAKDNACFPDFITTLNYPHHGLEFDQDFLHISESQDFLPAARSSDRHFTRNLLKRIRSVLEAVGEPDCPIWMDEWNSTLWQRDLSGDTCYKAAWLCQCITENYDDAESFGYWLLTDFMEERGAFLRPFHGGYGLFTYNGIPKSGWQALCLLRRLGEQRLAAGDWYFVTREEQQIQLLLFHYCDYDNLYRYRYRQLERPEDAYRVFAQSSPLKTELRLTGLPPCPHRLHTFRITRSHGSSFDQWVRWGAPAEITPADLEQLQLAAAPEYESGQLCPDEAGTFLLQTTLKPHEVVLYQIDLCADN